MLTHTTSKFNQFGILRSFEIGSGCTKFALIILSWLRRPAHTGNESGKYCILGIISVYWCYPTNTCCVDTTHGNLIRHRFVGIALEKV